MLHQASLGPLAHGANRSEIDQQVTAPGRQLHARLAKTQERISRRHQFISNPSGVRTCPRHTVLTDGRGAEC
jgi:hypothetical protein